MGTVSGRWSFIDLFAGIGGFRIGLEACGGECVFSCERDVYARRTYEAWFGEAPFGDIRELTPEAVPQHDVLAAGFPCQPFSIAGVSKKNSLGRAHGFACERQGNLFFAIAEIARVKRPAVLFLENVKNLRSHDRGNTWRVIERTLEELNYRVFAGVVDAAGWVPQHRERVYIVCFDRTRFREAQSFEFPRPDGVKRRLRDVLEVSPAAKYTLTPRLWRYLQDYAAKHRAAGNGFGCSVADPDGVSRTLSARYFKDGSEILIARGGGDAEPRRLTPGECARLMGFEGREDRIVVSDTQAYRQFGNAVVPKVIEAIGREIVRCL